MAHTRSDARLVRHDGSASEILVLFLLLCYALMLPRASRGRWIRSWARVASNWWVWWAGGPAGTAKTVALEFGWRTSGFSSVSPSRSSQLTAFSMHMLRVYIYATVRGEQGVGKTKFPNKSCTQYLVNYSGLFHSCMYTLGYKKKTLDSLSAHTLNPSENCRTMNSSLKTNKNRENREVFWRSFSFFLYLFSSAREVVTCISDSDFTRSNNWTRHPTLQTQLSHYNRKSL